ncbi:MAG: MBL fold metallo-hydrolase [Patescibacteria group bacterium]
MHITWLGHSCFKIQGKDVTIVTDPYAASIGLKLPRLSADIVTVSHGHHDHSNVGAVSGQPFVIDAPGEYETKGVFIGGIPAWHDAESGASRGSNTIYLFQLEGVKLAHLGDLGGSLTDEQLEKLEGVDILFLPVGGTYTLDGVKAADLVNQLEPRIVIPMHYKIHGLNIKLDGVEKFLTAMGTKNPETVDKLRTSKKELPVEETRVVVLKPLP